MPRTNITIDDTSPLISYLGNWTAFRQADYYANGTYTKASTTSSQAVLTFNGTGVWIYGSKVRMQPGIEESR